MVVCYNTIGCSYFYVWRDTIVSITTRDPTEKMQLKFIRQLCWTLISGIIIGMLVSSVLLPFWLDKDVSGYPILMIVLSIAAIPLLLMAMFAKIHSIPFVYPEALKVEEDDLADADVALYVLNRRAGEGADRSLRKGDWQLTDAEVENIRALSQHYRRFVLVINAGGFVDLSPLDAIPGIGAVLFYSEAGEEGGNALAEILSGAASPSGHLTQTWARHYEDYPSASLFGSLDGNPLQTDYKEGILVGYRHFEAQGISPRFPFGYGLSYTSFSQKLESLCSEKGIVRLSVLMTISSAKAKPSRSS